MRYSIAITPKQKSISFEDKLKVIEPLIEKKEALNTNIEKQQDDLAALEPLISHLDPNNADDIEYINAFNKYKSDLTNFSTSIAGRVYDPSFKQQARDLKDTYLGKIKPLSDAVAASQKAKDAAAKDVMSGYLLGKQNAFNTPVSAYMNGNDPRGNFYAVKTSDITKQGEDLASSISQRMYEEAGSDFDVAGYKAYISGILASDDPISDILKNPKFADALGKAREQFGFSNLDTAEKEKAEAALLTGFISGLQGELSYQKQQFKPDPFAEARVYAEVTGNDGNKYYELRNYKGQVVGYTNKDTSETITPHQYNKLATPEETAREAEKKAEKDAKNAAKAEKDRIRQEKAQQRAEIAARNEQLSDPQLITDLGDARYSGRISKTGREGQFTQRFRVRHGVPITDNDNTKKNVIKNNNEITMSTIASSLLKNYKNSNTGVPDQVGKGKDVYIVNGDMLEDVLTNPNMANKFLGAGQDQIIIGFGGGATDDYHFASIDRSILEYYIDRTDFSDNNKKSVKLAITKQLDHRRNRQNSSGTPISTEVGSSNDDPLSDEELNAIQQAISSKKNK